MMSVSELIARKKELRYTNEEIATLSGIPLSTVRKIFAGVTEEPRRATLAALSRALAARPMAPYDTIPSHEPAYIREGAVAYSVKRQGEYTIYDYYALPEDRRAELIDGVIYDMAAPTRLHQKILMSVCMQLSICAEEKKTGYEVIPAPYDVQLDNDIYTMLQPDIVISSDDPLKNNHHFLGAPEFVVEILSPSTRSKDMLLKANKYHNAGVREYWIIDPKYRKVIVYVFDGEDSSTEYRFEDRIPVYISDGSCAVDFAHIAESISMFYDAEGKLIETKEPEKTAGSGQTGTAEPQKTTGTNTGKMTQK